MTRAEKSFVQVGRPSSLTPGDRIKRAVQHLTSTLNPERFGVTSRVGGQKTKPGAWNPFVQRSPPCGLTSAGDETDAPVFHLCFTCVHRLQSLKTRGILLLKVTFTSSCSCRRISESAGTKRPPQMLLMAPIKKRRGE